METNRKNTISSDNRSASGLLAIGLGAVTSAGVVLAALAGYRFGLVEVLAVLAVAGVILALNLRQAPQRPLLTRMPSQWDEQVVVRAPRAAQTSAPGTPHAA